MGPSSPILSVSFTSLSDPAEILSIEFPRASQKSKSQLLLANYCVRPLLGGGLHQQQTGSVLKQYFAAARLRSGLYPSQQTANGIVDSADDKLFELVLQSGDRHMLHELLTDRVDISYNLRSRSHDRVSSREEGT